MSTVQGGQGNIVTNGLVLNLDAANPRSYLPPYNGTTWFDLSGNSNNGTLTNGPTFNSGNGGSIVFDGVDDYNKISNSVSLQVGATFTINCWIKPGRLNRREAIFSTRENNTAGCWMLEVGTANSNTNTAAITGVGTFVFVAVDNILSLNTWVNITFVRTDNTTPGKMYINGFEVNSQQTTAYNIVNNNDAKYIGSSRTSADFFTGNIANVSLYNRALSPSEINQNFQATRARFGI